jgi:aspartate carbamoyltransferase regulatory subunit
MKDKILEVSALKDGTVIDHIPADSLFKVLSILRLEKNEGMITFGTNLRSKKLGKKAIIKLSDVFFKDKDINRIALIAPDAKLNIIRDYKVVEKKMVELPNEINGIVKCVNPMCVTNHEKITTRFHVVEKKQVKLRCHFCEKMTDKEHMEML